MFKKPVLLLVFLLLLFSAFSQSKALRWHRPTKAEEKLAEYHAQCVHSNRYSTAQRLKFYPFNKAVQVKLIAFNGMDEPNVRIRLDSGVYYEEKINYWKYPFYDNKTDTSQFIESKLLNKSQINRLTDLLYNIGQRTIDYNIVYSHYACYNPRNSIIFINAKGKIFAYIEICFECKEIQTKPESMKIGGYCEDKLSLLKGYFASADIKYGVDTAYTRGFSIRKSR